MSAVRRSLTAAAILVVSAGQAACSDDRPSAAAPAVQAQVVVEERARTVAAVGIDPCAVLTAERVAAALATPVLAVEQPLATMAPPGSLSTVPAVACELRTDRDGLRGVNVRIATQDPDRIFGGIERVTDREPDLGPGVATRWQPHTDTMWLRKADRVAAVHLLTERPGTTLAEARALARLVAEAL